MPKEVTLKDAIKILDPRTSKQTLDEYEYYGGFRGKEARVEVFQSAILLACESMRFKDYFDALYGQGLEVENWHLNSDTEPFDNFYESALAWKGESENERQEV